MNGIGKIKIARIFIQDHWRFKNFQLDLTYPEGHEKQGQALDRVFLDGNNASGIPRLFSLLTDYLRDIVRFKSKTLCVFRLEVGKRFIYSVHLNNNVLFFRDEIDESPEWLIRLLSDQVFTMSFNNEYEKYCIGFEDEPDLLDALWFSNNPDNQIIYQPGGFYKDKSLAISEVPNPRPNEIDVLKTNFPVFSNISAEYVNDFWAIMSHHFSQADAGGKEDLLNDLLEVWTPVLDAGGFELDNDSLRLPGSFREQLMIRLKDKVLGELVEYKDMETGIRRLLFNTGHIFALNQNKTLQAGFAFIEDLAAHLHPSLAGTAADTYLNMLGAYQVFFSGYSNEIREKFKKEEIISLHPESNGYIAAS